MPDPPRRPAQAASAVPAASGDMFLKVKGARHGVIKGESDDSSHREEIEVLRWSWGMQGMRSLASGAGTGRAAAVKDLTIVKKVDRASIGLMLALRTNEEIQQAVLTVRKAGDHPLEYLKITIENARVVSLSIDGGDQGGGADLIEQVGFTFNTITVEYTPQGPDGQARGGLTFTDEAIVG